MKSEPAEKEISDLPKYKRSDLKSEIVKLELRPEIQKNFYYAMKICLKKSFVIC